ncbi:MAG: hypothetical protein KDE31_32160, partial [Caldilineaceae bacterium]|nr:hypothetical protein [Caldilineaceae bacterium]
SHTVLILQRGDHQPSHVAPPIRPIAARWPQLSRTILLAALILVVLTVSWPVLSPHIGTQIQRMVGILPDVWVAAQEHIVIRLNETVGAIGKAAGAVGEGDTTISASTNLPAAGPPAVEQPAVASIATAQTSPTTSTAMLAGNSGLTLGTKAGDAFTGSTIRPAIMMEWAPILAMALANGAGRVAGTNTMTELSPIVALINQIVGNQAIGDTVNDIQLQAAPALAVAGSTISYTATNTVVPDTSTATPIPTGTPTAKPIPPTPPPPTPLPTNTARAVQPTRRPATPTPIPSPSPAFIDLASANVTIIEPDVGDTLAGKRPFRWKANFSLPPGYAFEVIFWRHGQDALTQGKGYAGSTTDTTLNAEANNFRIRNAPEGEYQWGVILIRAEPYQRVKFLGGGQVIYVRR